MAQPPSTYCPFSPLGPWASEIFPGCPPYPYGWTEPWCGGNACARPCGRNGGGFSGNMGQTEDPSYEATFAYDDRGRWISQTDPKGEVVIRCTYRGDVLDACVQPKSPIFVERDVHGRISAITRSGDRYPVARNAEGRVIAIGRYEYGYDERGRLNRNNGYTLEYDARDRVVRAVQRGDGEPRTIEYTYDGDHLVKSKGPGYDNMSVAYDAQGRVAGAGRGGLETGHNIEFDYECKKP